MFKNCNYKKKILYYFFKSALRTSSLYISSTKLSTSTDLKKNESGENDNVEIVDDNNNIIQDLMESKTKFDFKNTNIKDLKPKKDLKPVIAKKKENKEIKILRETFAKEPEKNEIKNINNKNVAASKNDNLMNSNKFKKGIFAPGIRGLKDMKGQNEKIVIKSKNIIFFKNFLFITTNQTANDIKTEIIIILIKKIRYKNSTF